MQQAKSSRGPHSTVRLPRPTRTIRPHSSRTGSGSSVHPVAVPPGRKRQQGEGGGAAVRRETSDAFPADAGVGCYIRCVPRSVGCGLCCAGSEGAAWGFTGVLPLSLRQRGESESIRRRGGGHESWALTARICTTALSVGSRKDVIPAFRAEPDNPLLPIALEPGAPAADGGRYPRHDPAPQIPPPERGPSTLHAWK